MVTVDAGQSTLAALIACTEYLGMNAAVRVGNAEEIDRALEAGALVLRIPCSAHDGERGEARFTRLALDVPTAVCTIADQPDRLSDNLAPFAQAGAAAILLSADYLEIGDPTVTIRSLAATDPNRWGPAVGHSER